MASESVVIFVCYMAVYCAAFVITSMYCAYLTKTEKDTTDSCVQKLKKWIKLTWSFKSLYLAIIPHIFDQATDVAVIYEYYILQKNKSIENVIDTFYLFWMSIILFLLSRLVSSIAIFRLTKNKNDFALGLLDLVMAKAIYVGYLLKRESPTNIQRYVGLLEATLEAFPQLLISTFFITTVVAHNDTNITLNPLIPISLLFSLYSLTSRVATDDKAIYNTDWKHLELKISRKKVQKCKCINYRYLLRVLLRFMEISSRLILYVLLWINFGGFATGIILFVEFIFLLILAFIGGSVEVIGNMMYFVMAGDWNKIRDLIMGFLGYRFVFSYIYLIIITVFSNVNDISASRIPKYSQRHTETIDSQFGLGLLIYCWICHFIWPCCGTFITVKFASRDGGSEYQKERYTTRSLDSMIDLRDCDGLVDLITFGVPLDYVGHGRGQGPDIDWQNSNVIMPILVYYSMLHSVDDDNNYILAPKTRRKAIELMNKHHLMTQIHLKDRGYNNDKYTINPCTRWNVSTELSRNGGGYVLMESNDIILDCGIWRGRKGAGYFGDNEYNNTKGKVINKELTGKLYHGTFNNYRPGGGTLILCAKNTITIGKRIVIDAGNGNVFICCKQLILKGDLVISPEEKYDKDRDRAVTIAIYCDELNDAQGRVTFWEDKGASLHRGTYQQGVNIMNQRKDKQ